MPEDSKKHHDKKKNDPKEQRRPRQRHQQAAVEKKQEKKVEDPKHETKLPQKPVYEAPPPEFFKNLKRETDEILKITEEENSKYKKKEIQSNWSKYEMPIESYDEIEEQENLGADYEKLIQAPLSIGGHFQFKHEKSWDMNTGPSLYDKYFEINMEDLNLALCTIPFYERNLIDKSNFSETDILSMNNRSTRFKQKYYNDKSYSTPETEAQDKILNSLRESIKEDSGERDTSNDIEINCCNAKPETVDKTEDIKAEMQEATNTDVNFEFKTDKTEPDVVDNRTYKEDNTKHEDEITEDSNTPKVFDDKEDDSLIFGYTSKPAEEVEKKVEDKVPMKTVCKSKTPEPESFDSKTSPVVNTQGISKPAIAPAIPKVEPAVPKATEVTKKNPVIESPEDLEKWLDDFLDG